MDINGRIAREIGVRLSQIDAAVKLLDEGNTVPFIARYRKEATGSMDDIQLRSLESKLSLYRAIDQRRAEVERLIDEAGKLTDEIKAAIAKADSVTELDDIYRPYRPKRRTRATIAAEAGLSPLAELILAQEKIDIDEKAKEFINEEKKINTAEDALKGACDIIAERVSDDAEERKYIRELTYAEGEIACKAKDKDTDSVYRNYYDCSEPVRKIPSHRILAINRGEKEKFITVKINAPTEKICAHICNKLIHSSGRCAELLKAAGEDGYNRLIAPSVENEIRNILTDNASERAMSVFGDNLKHLLMIPPVRGKAVMGFDPAYRTGCKIAVVDEFGNVVDTSVVYPTPPQNKTEQAKKILKDLIYKHNVEIISVGNGTASKESEIFVCELLKELDRPVSYIMTNEAGASVYSASEYASKELPGLDVSLRSAVSIARRLQDPLAELVKIDQKSIGVGQYQHDMDPAALSATLDGVVENCVSAVGADLNTASVSLLSRIAGINAKIANNICDYRKEKLFKSRSELLKVKGIGEKTYNQCVGFLRVPESDDPLDNTAVHPESYDAARKLLKSAGLGEEDIKSGALAALDLIVKTNGSENVAKSVGVGVPTLQDIISELHRPGRDPRDELPKPILRTDAMDISMLKPGMEFEGTVRNVADFGAFVDIGVHQDGLVHISKLGKGFVKRASDEVSVGDIIKVRVLDVDAAKKRISLERIFVK